MSYVRIWVHIVFSTKNCYPFLTSEIRTKVKKHIMSNCEKNNIYLQSIDGYTDHLHCFISLGKEQTVGKVCQLIKGESSIWINKNKLTEENFSWQDGYWAVSVSESQAQRVIQYIKNQEAHHSKKTFQEEIKAFSEKFGWKIISDD